ncbi:AcrR family transcriptional regulator [Rhodococcus sp. 27YEA15]|uniref:TetR/AcrR family transcriptional regulator n=1 Tax=Rhodococcus sp. 27YEA15 TaxID=3156259 RepID=UPI003C7CCE8F
MTNVGPGRPRLTARRRPGGTARAEILDAAAELFTTRGFAATSTRHIAEAVGMRQASLYNHFATKDDILLSLLEGTITPALRFADQLATVDAPAPTKLYALAYLDSEQLISERWNLGALYLLPELRSDRFSAFRTDRELLRDHYRSLARECVDSDNQLSDLPFRLVESVIAARADQTELPEADIIASAAVRVLGLADSLADARSNAADLIRETGNASHTTQTPAAQPSTQ